MHNHIYGLNERLHSLHSCMKFDKCNLCRSCNQVNGMPEDIISMYAMPFHENVINK